MAERPEPWVQLSCWRSVQLCTVWWSRGSSNRPTWSMWVLHCCCPTDDFGPHQMATPRPGPRQSRSSASAPWPQSFRATGLNIDSSFSVCRTLRDPSLPTHQGRHGSLDCLDLRRLSLATAWPCTNDGELKETLCKSTGTAPCHVCLLLIPSVAMRDVILIAILIANACTGEDHMSVIMVMRAVIPNGRWS